MRSKRRKVKVLVVEDEPMTRDALRIRLTRDTRTTFFGAVETVADAMTTLESIRSGRSGDEPTASTVSREFPDVILVDMRFRTPNGEAGLQGLDLIEYIDQMRTAVGDLDIKLLCLSNVLDPETIIRAINAGANGYLDKLQADGGWIEAIDLVHQGYYVFSPSISRKILLAEKFTHIDNVEIFEPEEVTLTQRAREIAFLYWQCGLSAGKIAEELGITVHTVRYHLGNIRKSRYLMVHFGEKISR
jgi:DNA-binding NarL/FixJ family response regulator